MEGACLIGSTGTNRRWYEVDFVVLLTWVGESLIFWRFFGFWICVLMLEIEEYMGFEAASVTLDEKLLHFVMIHSRNSLCRWTKLVWILFFCITINESLKIGLYHNCQWQSHELPNQTPVLNFFPKTIFSCLTYTFCKNEKLAICAHLFNLKYLVFLKGHLLNLVPSAFWRFSLALTISSSIDIFLDIF